MDIAYISAFSALAGSIIGGLTSSMTAWISQRDQVRSNQLAHEKSRREDLYKDFIILASKMYGDAEMNKAPQTQEFVALHTMVTRMRILSSTKTIACADRATGIVAACYDKPSKTPREIGELIRSSAISPLKEFSEAAREELRT